MSFILNQSRRENRKNVVTNEDQKNEDDILFSLHGIDSILSMDDTLLKSIENDVRDEICMPCPVMHEETQNFLTNDWEVHDLLEEHETFENIESVKSDQETSLEFERETEDICSMSCNMSDEEDIEWQDNTLLNQAFTQLSALNEDGSTLKYSSNNIKENTKESRTDSESIKNHVESENLLKRNTILCNNVIPNKKFCTKEKVTDHPNNTNNTDNKHDKTFYGLPSIVKKLILEIKGIKSLYSWQDECLNLRAIKERKNLIYALPTSGGKTLVAEILMLKEIICNKKNAIFILPFVAIVQEKVQSMAPFALELDFLVEEYAAARGTYPPKKRRKKNSVYMCTIEKALGLVNSLIEEKRLKEIGMIVVDELHLLGESGGRGATLEGLLTKVLYIDVNIHIIGMSATIGNLNEIAQFLNAELYTGNFRPVEIKEYVKCDDNIWLLNLKTEELLTDLKKINYRYSQQAAIMDPDRIGGLVMDVVPADSCLIFCPSRKNCENVALLLSKVLFKSLENHKKEEKEILLRALRTEEGLCPILHKTIKFGVAYHHSGLTSEERRLLEDAFRIGTLCIICCTSTLAAGVNLPARRVILRSPYVGNQFLNLSRYKQMIGRAGRAGMGDVGESILICKSNELPKVKELLTSKMDDSLSTLHIDQDRGINNLILSSTLLSIARTRSDLHKVAARTLLSYQQERLSVNVKKLVDHSLSTFLRSGVMKVKKKTIPDSLKTNISIVIPSQTTDDVNIKCTETKEKKILILTSETELELCNLGRAAMKGCVDMQCAHTLYQDLKQAQRHLILINHLHLLYLVTPYDIVSQIKPVGTVYYDVVTKLSQNEMETARLLGINEATASKLRDGFMPKTVESRIVNRFYVTLILYELWNHHAVYTIAEKYQVSRGIIQNLLNGVSSFAASVVRFCQELDEFWAFTDVLSTFTKKLSYCCPLELEALMELPLVKIGRARQLYNAGFKTVQCIAKANPTDLQEKVPYLTQKTVIQIIEAAKLLIIGKLEDLKDEAEDVLDGIVIDKLGRLKI